MSAISLQGVEKRFGDHAVIHSIDLEIAKGEFIVFVGPSGCGKSTLLRMIAGLEEINAGDLYIEGVRSNDVAPAKRGIAMVFQSYALYPHMTVYDNLGYSLRVAGVNRIEKDKRVRAAAEMLQLTPLLKRYPRELSGGQRQRVAIGRAIVRQARVFLFDEPLSNLDAALRVATRIEIAKLKENLPDTTMIYVTHDQVEAMTLADRIVVLNGGRIEQIGEPVTLYESPQNTFVAGFIGSPAMNLLPASIEINAGVGEIRTQDGAAVRRALNSSQCGDGATLGVRPEHLRVCDAASAKFSGKVELVEHLGEVTLAHLKTGTGLELLAKLEGTHPLARGDDVFLTADDANLHCFDASGQAIARG
ncbi:MAG: ABC transporter ATP-binding protein [Pelagibacterium sp. SCN 63-23]|nr:MAG: ABC transporter ATP-binding protein [Pelagibacterium sp. SCN 63-23]